MKILVTGASGFIGNALCGSLVARGQAVSGALRKLPNRSLSGVDYRVVADLSGETHWLEILNQVDAVVHCAARVHIMRDTATEPLVANREVNVKGTVRLAEQAVESGVKRFIFLSSIKVNGESTSEFPFKADDIPTPEDPYGLSKWETEQALRKIAEETGLEVVIIRPPLVYGPGVQANFLKLMQVVKLGIPLPLGAIRNRRSLVGLDNLVDLIATCLHHPLSVNQTFLVSDGDDLSTPELLRRTAAAMGKSARLIPVPEAVLRTTARLLGRADFAQRLCGSLQADISKTHELLEWLPPVSVDENLLKTARHFLPD